MQKWNTKMMAEGGIMLALAFVLSKIKFSPVPNGGSVTAGSMVPIILYGMRWGAGPGILVGMLFGGLDFATGGWFLSIPQVILEYPLAFGSIGLAGIFSSINSNMKDLSMTKVWIGTILAVVVRYICHLMAGVVFWGDTLPTEMVLFGRDISGKVVTWIASATYQLTYLGPELIISLVILTLIWKPISRMEK